MGKKMMNNKKYKVYMLETGDTPIYLNDFENVSDVTAFIKRFAASHNALCLRKEPNKRNTYFNPNHLFGEARLNDIDAKMQKGTLKVCSYNKPFWSEIPASSNVDIRTFDVCDRYFYMRKSITMDSRLSGNVYVTDLKKAINSRIIFYWCPVYETVEGRTYSAQIRYIYDDGHIENATKKGDIDNIYEVIDKKRKLDSSIVEAYIYRLYEV